MKLRDVHSHKYFKDFGVNLFLVKLIKQYDKKELNFIQLKSLFCS